MSALALALVLAAAVIHATWNYLLKRSGGGTLFVWSFATLSALIPPLLQDWATNLGRVVIMTPMALRRRADLGNLGFPLFVFRRNWNG